MSLPLTPQVHMPSMTQFAVERAFGQWGPAVLAAFPPNLSHTPSLPMVLMEQFER